MKIYVPFTLYFNDKNLYDKPPDLLFLVIYFHCIAFTSADIIFHKLLELHSTSDKKIFVTIFLFLADSFTNPCPCLTVHPSLFCKGVIAPTPFLRHPPLEQACSPF